MRTPLVIQAMGLWALIVSNPVLAQDVSPPSPANQGEISTTSPSTIAPPSEETGASVDESQSELERLKTELEQAQEELSQWKDRDAQEKLDNAKEAAKAKAAEDAKWPLAVMEALEQWERSWEDKPDLVSLEDDSGAILETPEEVHKRLKLLGTKVLSNREWEAYWKTQAQDAQILAKALRNAGLASARVEGLESWAELANKKVTNQQAYLDAILFERDSQEARLETMLEAEEAKDEAAVAPENPNPYEKRSLELAELERQIQIQTTKKSKAEGRIVYIQQQLDAEEKLVEAMASDEILALEEAQISSDQNNVGGSDPLSLVWGGMATNTQDKAAKISAEADHYKKRARTRQVELELTDSEVEYRDRRIAEVQAELDSASGIDTLLTALWETLQAWLTEQAWRILIALIVIWIGVRFANRMVNKGARIILMRTDDNPDEDDAGDQRRKTLADVFVGLARIAVYIVGGLVALEQIGINTGPILGSVAILGLAISFGSQNLVRDVVNGFFILLENQYAVGDVVELNGKSGTVEKITIRATSVREYSGNLHVIPNGTINMVSNMTREWSRPICDIGVSYDSDLSQVRNVIERVSQEIRDEPQWAEVIEEGPDFVGVVKLAESSVIVRVVAKTEAGHQWGLGREMNRRFKEAFANAGIEIPFPQQVVRHINATS